MSSKDAPCKNCGERYCGCHSGCERYLSFSEARKEENARRKEAKRLENGLTDHACELSYKIKRRGVKSKIFKSTKK